MLRHVTGVSPDLEAIGNAVVAKYGSLAAGRVEQPEQDLDQCRLASAVGTDETGDAGLYGHRELVKRGHRISVTLRKALCLNDRTRRRLPGLLSGERRRLPDQCPSGFPDLRHHHLSFGRLPHQTSG